ncbi:hypothetical protein R2360_15695 [Mycobacteroides chelonae]|nr:hypothetical protein [Mycobacteroides chelonae]
MAIRPEVVHGNCDDFAMEPKPCRVQKCLNEATEYLTPAGDVCAEHEKSLPSQEWILADSEQSVTGMAKPTILVGESLQALNEYILLEPPEAFTRDGSRQYNPPEDFPFFENRVPLRVRRRGDEERDFTLVVPQEMLLALAAFFTRLCPRDDTSEGGSSSV